MLHGKPRLALLVALLVSIVAAIFPFLPALEQTSFVQTDMWRIDHQHYADFAGGEFEGAMVLGGDEENALLTLVGRGSGTYTSRPTALSLAASSVAAHWTQNVADDLAVSLTVRTSPDGTTWTDWHEIEGEGGRAVGDRLKVFGNLVATGDARFAQYRVALSGSGTALPAVGAVTLFAFDSATTPRRSELRLALVPRDRALATIKPLGIVTRQQWGADERLRFEVKDGQPQGEIWPEEVLGVEKIVVHHTAGPNVCASAELYCQRQSVIAINDIYYYHAVVNGWGDIGYNSLVGYDGRIYEGRHGPEPEGATEPLEQPVVAGHAFGHNMRTHGIALMGDFQREPVPDIQYDALAKMVGWVVKSKLAAGGQVDPLGFATLPRGDGQQTPALPNIIGHRDVNDTECPGDFLYQRIVDLRHQVQRLVEWPPVSVTLRASPQGDLVSYHILVDNHEPDLVRRLTVKGAIPENVEFVDSWAGSPYQNRGVFDGSVVSWHDPEGQLSPGRDRREYVFIVRPRAGVARAEVMTTAWVEFAEPARGIAVSDVASADQPVVLIVDAVAGGRVSWVGDWPVSRNIRGYYGDSYQIHEPGDGADAYTWEADLPEPGAYEVFVWWTVAIDRATSAPYRVFARDGTHVARVNQREWGARWVSLGSYPFDAGPARVTLTEDPSGVAIADGVRFVKAR